MAEKPLTQPAARVVRPENLTDQAYTIIKKRILMGEYSAGDRLVERTLAAEFNISKTPVREALARLERETLVINDPGRGIKVRGLSLEEAKDILEARGLLEGFFARRASETVTEKDVSLLRRYIEKGEAACRAGDLSKYKDFDMAFHNLIRNRSGNAIACRIMASLEDQIRLVMTTSVTLPGMTHLSIAGHKAILAALEKRDPAAAERAAQEHIHNVQKATIRHWMEKNSG